MTQTNFNQIAEGAQGVMLVISAADLKAAVAEMCDRHEANKQKAIEERRELPTLTREQAARALNVTFSTLWRWAKMGYLTPVKIGTKVLYRASDIEHMLTSKQCAI